MPLDRHSVYHPELMKALFRDEFDASEIPPHITQENPISFFVRFINYNFNVFAAQYGCRVLLSERRTFESSDMWRHDLSRLLDDGDSVRLDEFKRAGFLCFWLRRRIVVDEIAARAEDELPKNVDDRNKLKQHLPDFMRYGNEICAFFLGYHLCLRFAASSTAQEEMKSVIAAYRLAPAMLKEIAVYLKAKNVSPHALYLMYKLIFRPLPVLSS